MVFQAHSIKIQQELALVRQHFLNFHECVHPISCLLTIFLTMNAFNVCPSVPGYHLQLFSLSHLRSNSISRGANLEITAEVPARALQLVAFLCQLLITRRLVWYACPLGGDWLIQWCQQWPIITLTLTLGYYTSLNHTTQGACISNTPGCYLINRSHLPGEMLKANTLACDPQL